MFTYIKAAIAGLVLLLANCAAQASDEWTPLNTQLEIAHLFAHVIDFGQTKTIAKNPDKYLEINPIIGKHPSVGKVRRYFIATAIAHTLVSINLSSEKRLFWQRGTLLMSLVATIHNRRVGISINF